MIHQITIDIVPYVLVYSVLIMSLCVFVFVNIPWSELLLEAPNISAGFLNVLLMGLGEGEGEGDNMRCIQNIRVINSRFRVPRR